MSFCRRSRGTESDDKRPNSERGLRSHLSSIIAVELMQVPIVLVFSVFIPSLFKFVTGSRELSDRESSLQQWPGLGETETFYSLISTSFSLGALVISPVAGQMPRLIGYRLSVTFACTFLVAGGLLYTFATNGWTVFAARFFMGVFDGCAYVFTYSYISKIGTEVCQVKMTEKRANRVDEQRRNSISWRTSNAENSFKDRLFAVNQLIKSVMYPVAFAITTVAVQLKQLNQFRWPGVFISVVGVAYCGLFLLLFRPRIKPAAQSKVDALSRRDKCTKRLTCYRSCVHYSTLTCKISSPPKCKEIFIYVVLIATGYLVGAVYNLIDTLLTPILSDNFGFTVEDTSLFFLATMFLPFIATLLLFLLKYFQVSNRAMLLFCILATLVGSLLASDWQSIGHDPCSYAFSKTNPPFNATHDNSTVSSRTDSPQNVTQNQQEVIDDIIYNNGTGDSILLSSDFDEYLVEGTSPLSVNGSLFFADHCKNMSTEHHTCYWNPISRVTGKLCIECRAVCRSERKSVNFVQFCFGICIILFVSQLFLTSVYSVASDYTPKVYQGTIISLITTGLGLARIITPLWGDWIYQLFEKRTLPPLLVFVATILVVLLGVSLSYKELTCRRAVSKEKDVRFETTNKNYLDTDV